MAHRQICAIVLCMLFVNLACAAPDEPPRYALSIRAALPLDEALQELARQTGLQILFFSKITTGRSAPELSGEYTIAAAMTRLLEGSGLTFRQVNEHTVEVRQAPPHSGRLPRNAHSPPKTFANESISNVTHIWLAPEALFNADPNEYMLRTMDATLTGELDWFAIR